LIKDQDLLNRDTQWIVDPEGGSHSIAYQQIKRGNLELGERMLYDGIAHPQFSQPSILNLSRLYYLLGEYEEFKVLDQKLYDLGVSDSTIQEVIIELENRNRFEEASLFLINFLKNKSMKKYALLNLAKNQLRLGKSNDAYLYSEEILKNEPFDKEGLEYFIESCFLLEKFSIVIDAGETYLKINQNNQKINYFLVKSYLSTANREKAIKLFLSKNGSQKESVLWNELEEEVYYSFGPNGKTIQNSKIPHQEQKIRRDTFQGR
jgi:tetratricopeptide (TPR) repeat protein